jgi:enamine deaminase RidA (YjgF/YER057c/UK114 family)
MHPIEARLTELGYPFLLDPPVRPFERVRIVGDMAYVSGHGPTDEHGRVLFTGRVGRDLTTEEGYEAARRVVAACLGSLRDALDGDLDRIDQVVKILAFVNSAPDFHAQPQVVNGFTELLLEVLGDRGRHARSAIGTSNLPNNMAVEVEMIVKVRPAGG